MKAGRWAAAGGGQAAAAVAAGRGSCSAERLALSCLEFSDLRGGVGRASRACRTPLGCHSSVGDQAIGVVAEDQEHRCQSPAMTAAGAQEALGCSQHGELMLARVRAPQDGALRPPGLLLLARTRWKAQVQQQPCRPSRAAVCGRLLPSGQRCSLANGRSALQRRSSVVAAARHWAPACWRRRPEPLARALASARPVAWLLAPGRPAAGGAACPARRPCAAACRAALTRRRAPCLCLHPGGGHGQEGPPP